MEETLEWLETMHNFCMELQEFVTRDVPTDSR